jgi:phosphoribosylcarboxyaminoimidazole (NCAIR) mutase
MAVSILSLNDDDLAAALANWRNAQTASIADEPTDA